jgi:hypothetical protein
MAAEAGNVGAVAKLVSIERAPTDIDADHITETIQ